MGCIQNVCRKDEKQGLSQLHLAAERGDTEAVRSLLMSSTNVDVLDTKHNTPLHIATLNGHVDVVNLLLSKNASVNSRNAFGQTSLHLASEIGHLAIAQLLLDSNADVDATDQYINTPVHIAALHGHYELVQLLINHSVLLICYGNRPLHLAAKCDHTEVAQVLLNYGENPDATNLDGDTPLHLASEIGHFAVVEVLLRNKAHANIRNTSCKTPLHFAAEMGYAEILKALIDHEGVANAVDTNGNTALHLAASNGHTAIVYLLLNKQTIEKNEQIRSQLVVNQVPGDKFELLQNPIKTKAEIDHTSDLIATQGGIVEVADIQLSHSYTLSGVCRGQATALDLAAERGHAEIVKHFMFLGVNVNACNKAKETPLHLACRNGHTSIVQILLDNHAIVDVMKQSDETPFYLAAKNGHADISDLLLRRGVCDFVLKYHDETPLHVAVKEGHTKVVEVILNHSCKISVKLTEDGQKRKENAKNLIKTTGIHPIQLLRSDGRRVSAGVVWTEKSKPLEIWGDSFYAETALDIAVISTQPQMVQLLLNADQCTYSEKHLRRNIDLLIRTIFHYDPTDGRYKKETHEARGYDEQFQMFCDNTKEIAQALMNSSKFNVNHQDEDGRTPLHIVMTFLGWLYRSSEKKAHVSHLIQMLLEKGAELNIKNSKGETPLMIASDEGFCDVIQILFDWEQKSGMKLDLDARDEYGETALIKAAERNHVSVMRLLLNHKASANVQDYYGFTALHAVVYEPNTIWFDFYFFCKVLLEMSSRDKPTWRKETVHPCTVVGRIKNYLGHGRITNHRKEVVKLEMEREIVNPQTVVDRLQSYLEDIEGTIRLREEAVNFLLDNDETNVNAIDVRGNTPLDLAVKSSKRINSVILKALKDRGAIHNTSEPKDETAIEVARVDERGRNPLHRLIISCISDRLFEGLSTRGEQDEEQFDFMVNGILLSPENFRELATATDNKGRIPLHYAVMSPSHHNFHNYRDPVRVLLEIGSEVNAVDIYGKTPLHYAEGKDLNERKSKYELLVQYGADENKKDNFGNTPTDLQQLRASVTIDEDNARKLTIGNPNKALYLPMDIAPVFNTSHVTELTRWKLVETIRIYSQSFRPQESSEEAIWKIWTENEPFRLNRRLSQLKPLIHRFIERLADGIREKDWRFECQPMLVGSADEETKAVISADFDFNFKLIKFSKFCDPFPHPLGPMGYFQLRRKSSDDTKSRTDENFDSFFNLDHSLLTNEVSSRFKIILEEVLGDPVIWQGEHLFDWNMLHKYRSRYGNLDGLCKTVLLRMIHPIEDGEGGFLYIKISIDIVACVHVKDWWPEDSTPVGIKPSVKTDGCSFILHRSSRFDPPKPRGAQFIFSETLARISFAQVESRIIKESSTLIKAAYIICKMMLNSELSATYQLKTCVLFCMEALNARNGRETRKEEKITPKQLLFWVERIMFCFMEFCRRVIYPTYFMLSFRRRASYYPCSNRRHLIRKNADSRSEELKDLGYCSVFDLYLDLCPDGSTFDIPMIQHIEYRLSDRSDVDPNCDPIWEQFDREEFIRTLSSRSSH